ncbi:hypothetical protein IQ230_15520 [Gloeocapsopsis crepidinum LEGE 06123]|uniref:Uncharacterized protein n=1 Tax=Gloeocapsopsis crepidinum LEGE 06123 TaxID=588587 RepID=A0ABR9UTY1_9CHRO|nr:hypothetical protein [Gloeocapsopsis crepidinum]MBE9191732.1 hypothetical protein [Gloeocapsopsis crepidinum LEGE 06123]
MLIIAIYLKKLAITQERSLLLQFLYIICDDKYPPAQSRATQATMLKI